ncbi:protein SRG1-like [Trifolium pratense]|uniref:Protein SRG1-like n=1 Tax=Trifolium pratense TaxID=57577 RepID=A0A2K3L3Y4_TRIPR|nr:protein SRG1-like [Trifolium pratense]
MGDTSILAPSVQELAKQGIQEVPEQYLQPNQDPVLVSNITSLTQLPIINFDKLLCEDDNEFEKLDQACKEWGFFQLINHGVDSSLVESVKIGVQQFFNLPMEEKKKFWQTEEELQGFGQVYVSLEEQKLRWGDMFYIKTFPLHIRLPHLLPCMPQPFRDNFENYSLEMKKLCFTIIKFMTKALKIQEPSELVDFFEEGDQSISGLTILLQVNEMQGLQIKKDGFWVPINPLPNAFVVNVGDLLEIMTNGIYRSIEHRATTNSEKERISVAAFHNIQMGRDLGPAPSLVTPESPALYKTITLEEYVEGYLASKIKGKSYLDVVRIKKESHE